jgi:hypothetical protein
LFWNFLSSDETRPLLTSWTNSESKFQKVSRSMNEVFTGWPWRRLYFFHLLHKGFDYCALLFGAAMRFAEW